MCARAAPLVGPRSARDDASSLLALVREMARELHPRDEGAAPVTLDSRLERDLGLGSLALVELIARVERSFGVELPENTIRTIATPRDLLALIGRAGPAAGPAAPPAPMVPPAVDDRATPDDADTLVAALDWHARRHPERVHILLEDGGERALISYGALLADATAVAHALRRRRLAPGETVALLLPTMAAYFPTFLGVVLAGGVPVPIYPPVRLSQIEDHLRRHVGILRSAGACVSCAGTWRRCGTS
jgi:acyl carrier protein